jgi:hypothetical protein
MFPSNKKNWATWIACKYGWWEVIMIIYEKSKKEKPQYGTNK